MAWGERLLGVLALLALRRISARGDAARGIVLGRRDLGFPSSVTSGGEAGSEISSRDHKRVAVASGLGDEGVDKKGDPVEEEHEPVQPREGLERLVLRAVACKIA